MEISRQTLLGALFIGSVLIVDGFILVEESSEPEGMVWVDAGSFSTSTSSDPTDMVEISGFWIDSEAITEAGFQEFLQATAYVPRSDMTQQANNYDYNLPVELADQGSKHSQKFMLAYEDAKAYCQWQGKKLTSKAQAEHAARDSGLQLNHSSLYCVKPHRSNDLATLWLNH